MRLTPRRTRVLVTIGVVALVQILLWLALPKPSFWVLDNGFKYQGARAFAETGTLLVPYHGSDFDPQGAFRPIPPPFGVMRGNSQLPVFPPLFMVIAGVFMRLFGRLGPFLLPLLGGLLTLPAGWLLWRRTEAGRDPRLFVVVLGLGSPLLFYSLTLWGHSLAIACVVASVALIAPGRAALPLMGRWESLIAGFLMAVGIALRTEVLIFALTVLVFWSYSERPWHEGGKFIAGLIVGLLLAVALNLALTGAPLPLHIGTNLAKAKQMSIRKVFYSRANNFYTLMLEGFRSQVLSVGLLLPLLFASLWRWWRKSPVWWYLVAMGVLVAWTAYLAFALKANDHSGYTITSGGLLWVMPLTAFALLPFGNKLKGVWGLMWAGVFVTIVVMAIGFTTVSGVHWGPRFIVHLVPFAALIAVVRLQRLWRSYRFTRPLVILIVLISILNQFYSYNVLKEQRTYTAALNRWAASTGSEPVLTPIWYLPGDCGLVSGWYPWFLTNTRGRITTVVNRLRESGADNFNYLERPPYLKNEFWWGLGVQPVGEDYLLERDGQLRRRWLSFIR